MHRFIRARSRSACAATANSAISLEVNNDSSTVVLEPPLGLHWMVLHGNLHWSRSTGSILLLLGFCMILVQTLMASALFITIGNEGGSCASHVDCGIGKFCSPEPPAKPTTLLTAAGYMARGADLGTCWGCGHRTKSGKMSGHVLGMCHANGSARDPIWESACGACTSPAGLFIVNGFQYAALYHLDSMSSRQWLTYLIVATLGVGVIMQEARSALKVVAVAAGGRAAGQAASTPLWPMARRVVLAEQFMRGVMVSLVAGNVPYFVLTSSAKVVDILLNTFAALLLLDLDWISLLLLADERTAREMGAPERLRLSRRAAALIARGEKAVAAVTMLAFLLLGRAAEHNLVRTALPTLLVLGAFTVATCYVYYQASRWCTGGVSVSKQQACGELIGSCVVGCSLALLAGLLANDTLTESLYVLRPDTR